MVAYHTTFISVTNFSVKWIFLVFKNKQTKQDRQSLRKANYRPRAKQHLVNPGQLVQAIPCTLKDTQNM